VVDETLEEPESCSICGRPLGYSPDDQPYWPTGPMCGDCYQSRQMDDEIFWTADSEDDAGET
jgi:hypothetical protein